MADQRGRRRSPVVLIPKRSKSHLAQFTPHQVPSSPPRPVVGAKRKRSGAEPDTTTSEPDNLLFNFNGGHITEADQESTVAQEWFTANVLHFHQQYLVEKFIDPANVQPRIKFLEPSVAALVQDGPWRRPALQHIFNQGQQDPKYCFAVLKSDTPAAPGSHLSLLLIVDSKLAYHFDNEGHHNQPKAEKFLRIYDQLVTVRPRGRRDKKTVGHRIQLKHQHLPSDPTHDHPSNCGPAVQWATRTLVRRIIAWHTKGHNNHELYYPNCNVMSDKDFYDATHERQIVQGLMRLEQQLAHTLEFHVRYDPWSAESG